MTVIHDGNFKTLIRFCLHELPHNRLACDSMADWDVSRVTDFSTLFWEPASDDGIYDDNDDWVLLPGAETFDVDLSRWVITSRATTMRSMFHSAASFNQPIMGVGNSTSWDVSQVTDMSNMFEGAKSFNQAILSLGDIFNTERVTDMSSMFRYAEAFDNGNEYIDKSNAGDKSWNVSNVKHFQYMFHGALSFKGLGAQMEHWDVSGARDDSNRKKHEAFGYMFQGATSFNGDISGWNIPFGVGSLAYMFQYASSFNQDLSSWDVQHVTDFTGMFENAKSFQQTLCWSVDDADDASSNNHSSAHATIHIESMLDGTNGSQLNSNVQGCILNKQLIPKHPAMPSSSSQLLLLSMILMGSVVTVVLLACSCCTTKVVKRRRQKRRFVFRTNKVEEEQILFHYGDDDAVVEMHHNNHAYFHDEEEEEGEISFVEEDCDSMSASERPSDTQQTAMLKITSGSLFGDGSSSHHGSVCSMEDQPRMMPLEDAVSALTAMSHHNDILQQEQNTTTSSLEKESTNGDRLRVHDGGGVIA